MKRFALAMACMTAALYGQGRGGRGPVDITSSARFDRESVARGEKAFGDNCARCHGANARGGKGKTEIDLIRSPMVLDDMGGREIGEFLKFGRPEKGMPKFDLAEAAVVDIATWLHRNVTAASERGMYRRLNVFSGDAKAGAAYFNGAGKCNTCHSATGDMKGLAAKNGDDAPTIQALIVSGGGGGGRGRGGRGRGAAPFVPSKTSVTATLTTQSGEKFTGYPVMVSDFAVTLQLFTGEQRSWLRDGDWPKVAMNNPLQAHVDLATKYTDADIHNLAAYLRTLN